MVEPFTAHAVPFGSEAPRPLFPPALIPILRERAACSIASLEGLGDDVLVDLLTVVFFAGLEKLEGAYYPVRVAFAGRISADTLLPEGDAHDARPMLFYRWSTLRIEPDRPFTVSELVKLGVVTRSDRIYTKVALSDRGLRVVGLAREGVNREGDPYLKVIAPRPGVLSIQHGHQEVVEYEQGRIEARHQDVFFAWGVVRRALETAARNAQLGDASMTDYLDTVRALVREMAAHGKGGILIISPDARPMLPPSSSYRAHSDFAIAQLLHYLDGAAGARRAVGTSPSAGGGGLQLRHVLRSAFVSETERWVCELGAFTAMDGATVLDCALGLCGFGVVLPVARDIDVVEAGDAEVTFDSAHDLSTRGARHGAAVTYARNFPGSVVFAASQDGVVSCLLAEPGSHRVALWRLGARELY